MDQKVMAPRKKGEDEEREEKGEKGECRIKEGGFGGEVGREM